MPTLYTVTSRELQRSFGKFQDIAMTQPVAVTNNRRERLIILSAEEYRRLKRRAREVVPVGASSNDERDAIANTNMASHHDHLDRELS
jgi:PHD/YefM family antitoxin component YafN of YafNO toxin-antitoxin module